MHFLLGIEKEYIVGLVDLNDLKKENLLNKKQALKEESK